MRTKPTRPDRTPGKAAIAEKLATLPAAEAGKLRRTSAHRLLILGASSGNQEMIARAIEEEAPLDLRLDYGRGMTALHAAVNWARPAAVRQLLKAGADPDVQNANGQTPAEFARGLCGAASPANRKRLSEIIELLEPKQPSHDCDGPSP